MDQPEQRARWKRCTQSTDAALGEALGQVFVTQQFPPSSKAATVQMVRDIEAAMDADIDSLNWMSPETKAKAKEKLIAVANKIGYPEKWPRLFPRLKSFAAMLTATLFAPPSLKTAASSPKSASPLIGANSA